MRQFALRVAAEIDSRGVLDVLRQGVKDRGVQIDLAYFRPGHTLAAGALDEYNANVLGVARQFHFSFRDPSLSVDLAFFVNGLPVATVELKNPNTGQNADHAIAQYRRPGPERPVLRQAHPRPLRRRSRPGVHHHAAQGAGIPSSCRSTSAPTGREGRAGPGTHGPLGILIMLFLISGTRSGSGTTGWRSCSGSCTSSRRTRRPGRSTRIPRRGFSRGSTSGTPCSRWSRTRGNTGRDTTTWSSIRLGRGSRTRSRGSRTGCRTCSMTSNQPVFHKVIVITDRVVLDRQLQRTIFQFDHTPGVVKKIDVDSAQLAEALEDATSKIIISTLQMYPFVLDKIAGRGAGQPAVRGDHRRGALLPGRRRGGAAQAGARRQRGADARRTRTRRTYMTRVRGPQPNLSYFAFTATPKSSTLKLFGTWDPDKVNPRDPASAACTCRSTCTR